MQNAEICQDNDLPEDIGEGRNDTINDPLDMAGNGLVLQSSSGQECTYGNPSVALTSETLNTSQSNYNFDQTGRDQNTKKRNISCECEIDHKKLKSSSESLDCINSPKPMLCSDNSHSSGLEEKIDKEFFSEYTPGSTEILPTFTETFPKENVFKFPTVPSLNNTKQKGTSFHCGKRESHSESDIANLQPKHISVPYGTSLPQSAFKELRKSLPSTIDSQNSRMFLFKVESSQSNNSTNFRNSTRFTMGKFPETLRLLRPPTTNTVNKGNNYENLSLQSLKQNDLVNKTKFTSSRNSLSTSDKAQPISAEVKSKNPPKIFLNTLQGYIDQVIHPCNHLKGIHEAISSVSPVTSASEDTGNPFIEQTDTCYRLVAVSFLLAGYSLDLISATWNLLDVVPMLSSNVCKSEPETHLLIRSLDQLHSIRNELERELHIVIKDHVAFKSSNESASVATNNTGITDKRRRTESLLIKALGVFLALDLDTMTPNNNEAGEQRSQDINPSQQNSVHSEEFPQELKHLGLQPTVSKSISNNVTPPQYDQTSLTDLNNESDKYRSYGDSSQYDTLTAISEDLEAILLDEKQNENDNRSELWSLKTGTPLKDNLVEESTAENTPGPSILPGASASKYFGSNSFRESTLSSRRGLTGSPTYSTDSDYSQLTELVSLSSSNSLDRVSDDREYYSAQVSTSGSSCKSLRDQEYLTRLGTLSLITEYKEPASLLPEAGTTQSESGCRKRKGFIKGKLLKFIESRFFKKNGA